ncbi:MAG: cyclic nucleotide-binding domain-containing protein, partial [Burkholderiales bacterium]|nr:cyclic nucleotide-binding domain-containing protein [Burkholderiales bacterium]
MTRGKRQRHELANIEAFAHLSNDELSELESQLTLVTIKGGETLISAGEPSDAFYLVVSGRFHVVVPGVKEPVAEIGTGKSIGEIGFFSGSARTATVIASRDSLVLRLLREDFDSLCKRSPEIWPKIVAMMARRLVRIATEDTKREKPMPRTIAVCHAGAVPVPDIVVEKLKDVFCENSRCEFLTSSALHKKF